MPQVAENNTDRHQAAALILRGIVAQLVNDDPGVHSAFNK
jgi:hypothetical protein